MPRAGGCDKYGGTKLHDTTYADSRAGAVSCNMTAIPPARLLCQNEYEQALGDSGVDMQTAVNSGVTSIGVTWGFRDLEQLLANGAQYIADEPCEIMRWVR